MDKIIDTLYKEAIKAFKEDEVPISCVIVKDGKIIAKAHNKRQKSHLCIDHAEILAICKAEKKLGDWRLDGCEMYVTLKPCKMCMDVISQIRLSKIYYILDSNFNEPDYCKLNYVQINDKNSDFSSLMSDFFKNKR